VTKTTVIHQKYLFNRIPGVWNLILCFISKRNPTYQVQTESAESYYQQQRQFAIVNFMLPLQCKVKVKGVP